MHPAILYAAKSTEDKRDSIPEQLEDCREMAAENGWAVVGEYDDEGFSAYSRNRGKDWARAQEHAVRVAAETGQTCMLVAQAHDRFARGAGDKPGAPDALVEIWHRLRRQNVHLRTVEDDFDMRDSASVAAIGQRAHVDSRRKSKAVSKGMRRRARRGLGTGGKPPVGYEYKDGSLIVVPAHAEVVRRIFREFLAGVSMTQIARSLVADGVPAQRGKRWQQSTVSGILGNPAYIGKVRHGDEVYAGEHEPIIDTATWRRAESLLATRPSRGRGRPPKGRHLFRKGLLRCECGEAMVPRTNGGYEMYYCNGRSKLGKDYCSTPHLRRADIDLAVYNYFEQVALDVESTRRAHAEVVERKLAEVSALRLSADSEVQRTRERLDRIRRDYMDGRLDVDDWREMSTDLKGQLRAAEAEVERLTASERDVTTRAATIDAEQDALQQLADIRKAIAGDIQDADGVEAVRAALTRLFDAFILHRATPDRVHVELIGEMWLEPVVRGDAIAGYGPSGMPLPETHALTLSGGGTNNVSASRSVDFSFGPIPVPVGGSA